MSHQRPRKIGDSQPILIALALALPAMLASAAHPALKYGAPDTGSIIEHGKYVLSHDGRLRSARWVAEVLTKQS